MRKVFGFPDTVDEVSARLVAGGVVLLVALTVMTSWMPLRYLIAYGFLARVLTGPRLSPLGLLVTKVIRPRLAVPPRIVPGPPKRFAQSVGLLFSSVSLAFAIGGAPDVADLLLLLVGTAAALEAGLAICLGCIGYGVLQRIGVFPPDACGDCGAVGSRAHHAEHTHP